MKQRLAAFLVAMALCAATLAVFAPAASAWTYNITNETCDGVEWSSLSAHLSENANGVAWVALGDVKAYHSGPGCAWRDVAWADSDAHVVVYVDRWIYGTGWAHCSTGDSGIHKGYAADTLTMYVNNNYACSTANWPPGNTRVFVVGVVWHGGTALSNSSYLYD